MKLGVIADDFTGATDIASFLVENGMSTLQLNGVPSSEWHAEAQALVVSLKSRSCPSEQAIADSLAALRWLQSQGCDQFYFKYCSTFDSTEQGNIGPVTDALMDALGEPITIISPALPVNGRTIYKGYLFVLDQLLSESGMRHHPVNPMTDSYLPRLMERQARGRCAVITATEIDRGADALRAQISALQSQGYRYVVLDTLNEQHLLIQGEAVQSLKLVTGGSGLAIGIARQVTSGQAQYGNAQAAGAPVGGRCVVLSGSCSTMTQRQVDTYRAKAISQSVDIERCMTESDHHAYAMELCDWAEQHAEDHLAPLIYATTKPEELKRIQSRWGAKASSEAVENLFATIASTLKQRNFQSFIVAGGETSSTVAQSLGINAFYIGPSVSPGVPWVKAAEQPISLILKSGNFGDENFFSRAQEDFPV